MFGEVILVLFVIVGIFIICKYKKTVHEKDLRDLEKEVELDFKEDFSDEGISKTNVVLNG